MYSVATGTLRQCEEQRDGGDGSTGCSNHQREEEKVRISYSASLPTATRIIRHYFVFINFNAFPCLVWSQNLNIGFIICFDQRTSILSAL